MRNLIKFVVPLLVLTVGKVGFAAEHYPDHMKEHPRQDEVNHRLDRELKRIDRQEKSGKITAAQAEKMRSQIKGVYKQEQADKQINGGDHITKGQQGQLNKEENGLKREDARDAKQDAEGK
jgi:hypothetical protein